MKWGGSAAGLLMLALSLALAGCPRGAGAGGGCTKDRDCKGTRVCEQKRCVEPGSNPGGAAGLAASANQLLPPRPRPSPAQGAAATPAPPGSAGWMLGGGSRHLGQAPGAAPVAEPRLAWEVTVGGPIAATPLVGPDGTVYFGSHDRSVYAVDKSGKQLWSVPTGDRVWSTPALSADGVLYVGSDDDTLYALDARTGAQRWTLRIGACVPTTGKGPGAVLCDVDGGVTLGLDGTIYVGGDAVHAVTPEGKLRWRAATGGHVSSPPALSADGATVYVGAQDGVIYALDSASGVQRWSVRIGDQIEPAPVVADDGTIYVGADDHKLYALAPTGEIKWSVITGLDVRRAVAIGPTGVVYLGSHDKKLYAIGADGVAAWTFTTAGKIHSSPVVAADGIILVASEDDRVYAVSPAGVLLWFIDAGEDVDVQPWLTADGTLIVATDAGKLQAWR